jgi:hypothetical protein
VEEHYYPHSDSPTNACGYCGGATDRLIGRPNIVFTGVISARYNDKNVENPHQEGHWQWRKKSSVSGKPEPVFISDWQTQKEFCKAEGLANPREMPRNMEIASDGKGVLNTRGMPGTEL